MKTDPIEARSQETTTDRPSGPPHSAAPRPLPADRFGGYAILSVILHWLSAVLVAALIAAWLLARFDLHAAVGLVASPALLLHACWRLFRGFPRAADESAILSLVARLAILAALASMIMLVLTGLILAFASGAPVVVFDIAVPAPVWPPSAAIADIALTLHARAGPILLGALGVHLAAVLAYGARGLHAVTGRVIWPVRRGR